MRKNEAMKAKIEIRVSQQEKEAIQAYAAAHETTISDLIRNFFEERIAQEVK